MRRPRNTLAPLALAVAVAAVAAAETPLNPSGRLKGYKPGESERYVLWHDGEGWHVRLTTPRRAFRFQGKVASKGGRLEGVRGLELEAGDRWKLADGHAELAFDFSTQRSEEGVDFRCAAAVTQLDFDLSIGAGGEKTPTAHKTDRVFVGPDGQHPAAIPFSLPAHPKR